MTVPLNEDSTIYCALLLRKDSKYPELIPLFEEKEALALISPDEDETYNYKENGKKLSQVVWSKLLPSLKTGETVYFAASGLLHQLAIEALPYDEKHVMSDIYNLVRVSSTRELVLNKNDYKNTTATLYGGIQYAMDTTLIKTESGKYQNLAVNRGLDNDTLDRGKIRFLPGTKAEVEEINRLLQENHLQVQLFTATNANEESFKALSGKHQNILQIATHGFYWTDSTARRKDYFSQRILTLGNDMPSPPAIDPLNRCGLLFAGAQMAWSGQSADLPEGVQDGILTAKEISLLDLRDANLVVLSACETGKGEITGEGVFGLQRAFKQAGAQTIIMTLWPVNDQATRLFMTEFYHNWIANKQPKREAFRNAQNTVRAQYEEPTYWAGFVMLD
jgi:CHAT domain-containing protein